MYSPMPVGRVLNKQLENSNNNDKDKKELCIKIDFAFSIPLL